MVLDSLMEKSGTSKGIGCHSAEIAGGTVSKSSILLCYRSCLSGRDFTALKQVILQSIYLSG